MIKERRCSYEVARLLKEKGFDEECDYYYEHSTDEPHEMTRDEIVESCNLCIKAPTYQMAWDWLRIKHNILLFLLPAQENGKLVYLVEVWTWNKEESIYESTYAPMPRKEPEQAIEAALKYSLENLV